MCFLVADVKMLTFDRVIDGHQAQRESKNKYIHHLYVNIRSEVTFIA